MLLILSTLEECKISTSTREVIVAIFKNGEVYEDLPRNMDIFKSILGLQPDNSILS